MRAEAYRIIPVLLILLTPPVAASAAAAETDPTDHERIHRSYELAPGASVEVSGIAGPVEIETTRNDTAEVNVIRSAPTHADLECGKIVIQHTSSGLRISSESLCSIVRGDQRVTLKLPRRVDVSLRNIAGHVRIGPIDGMVRLESIAGHVTLAELRAASMSSLAAGLSMSIADVDDRGIHISSVTGGIDLDVGSGVDAELSMNSVIGRVHSETSDVQISRSDDSDYQATIGSGSGRILIESVVGGVDVRHAR